MKYKIETEIALPRERVIELFDNPENMKHWQEGFISLEHVSGTPGQAGAISKLRYKMGKSDVELIETITRRELPDRFDGTYECKGIWNSVNNRFVDVGMQKTRWTSECEFRFDGWMMKLMGMLMPGMFRKQSLKYMQQFKAFAEDNKSVLGPATESCRRS